MQKLSSAVILSILLIGQNAHPGNCRSGNCRRSRVIQFRQMNNGPTRSPCGSGGCGDRALFQSQQGNNGPVGSCGSGGGLCGTRGVIQNHNGGIGNQNFNQDLGRASFLVGSGKFSTTGIPFRVENWDVTDGGIRRTVAVSFDASNNIIATTQQFAGGQPVFDPSTGLSSDGRSRLTVSNNPSVNQVATGSNIPQASLTQGKRSNGEQGMFQTRLNQQPQLIEVVTSSAGTVFSQDATGALTQVAAQKGDLVVRGSSGRLILLDNAVAADLNARYKAMTSVQLIPLEATSPGSLALIVAVLERQRVRNAAAGSVGGSLQNPGNHAGAGGASVRPIDNSPPPNAWTVFKDKFENKASIPDNAAVDSFIKTWQEAGTDTAGLKMSCVSKTEQATKKPWTLFLSRTKNPATDPNPIWLSKIRVEKDSIESSKKEIEEKRGNETLLTRNETGQSLTASRTSDQTLFNYELKSIAPEGKLKFWMKVTATTGDQVAEYFCGETAALKDVPNPPLSDTKLASKGTGPEKAKLPALLARCKTCHAEGKPQARKFTVKEGSVWIPEGSNAGNLVGMLAAVTKMSKKTEMGLVTEAEIKELKSWFTEMFKKVDKEKGEESGY